MTGFESPNYTQTPNDLFDQMLPEMGYAELKVTLAVIRKTLGYHKESARMTITSIAAMTGLSRPSVLEGAEQAEKRGTLTRLNDGHVIEWTVNLLDATVNLLYTDCKPTLPPSNKETSKQRSKESNPRKSKPSISEDTCPQEWMVRLHALTGVSIASASGQSRKEIKTAGLALIKSGHTLDQVDTFERNWYADEWRKKNKIFPKPREIQDKFDAIIGAGNGHKPKHVYTQHELDLAAQINARRRAAALEDAGSAGGLQPADAPN